MRCFGERDFHFFSNGMIVFENLFAVRIYKQTRI